MQNPTIRQAKQDDLLQMLELLRAKAEFDGGIELLKATADEINEAFFGERPRVSAIVAEIGDELVGFATFFETFSTFLAKPCLWLDDLFVVPSHRSQGVGKLLLKELAHLAKYAGVARIDWNVAATNPRGQAFYEQIGAKIRRGTLTVRLDAAAIADLVNG
ncbi:MAG: GNAT family N-acetyltransferase [Cyanobacteria bacterium P01_A01_bin.123]